MNHGTLLMKLSCNRQRNGASYAAPHNGNLFQALCLCCISQRSDKIRQGISFFFLIQSFGGAADDLIDDGNRSLFPVVTGNGKRDPLPVLIHSQNDELTWLRLFCNERGFDLHPADCGVQFFFFTNLEHPFSSFPGIISDIKQKAAPL